MTWLKEKRGREMLGKTCRSSREQTDSISPRLRTQRQTGKGSGKGVSNLFPELRQSITPALPVTGHWTEWMCWVFLFPSETTAMWHHSLMQLITGKHVFLHYGTVCSLMYISGNVATEIIRKKTLNHAVLQSSCGVWSSSIDLCGNQAQSGLGLSLFKVTHTPL